MGELLVVAYIAVVAFGSGMILLFSSDKKGDGRKYGMIMVVVAVVLSILCIMFILKAIMFLSHG